MVIDNNLLDELTRRAKNSPRLRMDFDMRNSVEDGNACLMQFECKDGAYESLRAEDVLSV